jgi:hypothetical protein
LFNVSIRATAKQIPNKAPELLRVLQPGENLESVVRQIKKYMLETQPIITPRVLHNVIKFHTEEEIYEALPYCGYSFQKGPWADTLVTFGIDPRNDPQYRFFQTFHFDWTYDIFLFPGYTEIPVPFHGDPDKETAKRGFSQVKNQHPKSQLICLKRGEYTFIIPRSCAS